MVIRRYYSGIVAEDDEFKVLYKGDSVDFEETEGEKGPQASNVKVLERAPRQRRQY